MEKLFRENKTSPLLKTPEKDFHFIYIILPILGPTVYYSSNGASEERMFVNGVAHGPGAAQRVGSVSWTN